MRKNKKKIIIMGIGVFLVVFLAVFSFINLNYPTKINAYIAHAINKAAPANTSFTDEKFYNAVVDAYNKENGTTLPYTTRLTDTQLANIKEVSYSADRSSLRAIKSLSGLEKLTALTKLVLNDNIYAEDRAINIDLSTNTQLTYLDLNNSGFLTIKLNKNTKLTYLDAEYNGLTSVDLSNNPELTCLKLEGNELTSIDLSKNTKLTYLDIGNRSSILGNNRLTSIDLSKNTLLTELYLGHNKISNISLNENTKLESLNISGNSLTGVDLSNNPNLTYLNLNSNQLININLSNNVKLTRLYASGNALTSIDLSKNTELTYLWVNYNNLSNIDLSKNTKLEDLDISENSLTSVDLSKNINLTKLELYNNPLKYDLYVKYGGFVSDSTIKLPEDSNNAYPLYDKVDNEEISYDGNDRSVNSKAFSNKLKSLSVGKKSISVYLVGVHKGANELESLNVSGTISVYDFYSTKYKIDKENKYIYTKTDTDSNTILSNINFQYINGKIENNKLILYSDNRDIEEYTIVNLASTKYDLTKEYIYVGTNTFDKNNITGLNATIEENDNVLNIKYNGTVLESKKIVKISSTKYDLTKDYIRDSNFNKDNITVVNGTTEVKDNKLYIKYDNDVLQTYNILESSTTPSSGRLKGDINNNGTIDLWDVTLLYMHIRGTRIITDADALEAGKLTGHSSVTLGDVTKLYRYVRGTISEL